MPLFATAALKPSSTRPDTVRREPRRWTSLRFQPWAATVFLVLLFAQNALADLDPVKDFCRRFYHQTTVVDRRLYIDGGLLNYNPISQYPANFSNKGLLYQDLDIISDSGMPQLFPNLTKNSSVPDVSGGILWADKVNKKFYLFGGEYYQETPAPTFALYAYDILYDYWSSIPISTGTSLQRLSFGAGTSVSERGEGYYYGGWLSNNSVLNWNGPSVATAGLIKYTMDTNTFINGTGPDLIRRAEGSMVYIPASDGGMLIYFGGLQDPGNGTVIGQPMEQIFVYDILSSKWYTQTATGTVPAIRRRFCADVTWAPDQSSYNIYLYGGLGFPPNGSGYDDVYILTIPSFQWIKLYPNDGNYTGQYPHNGLSCNMVDGAQMLIIGGTFTTTDDCDAPTQFGTHNLDVSDSTTPWQLFSTNRTTYGVPDLIVSAVGGSAGGGATKTAPAAGWNNHDLQVLMTRKATVATRSPTRSVTKETQGAGSGTSLSTGAIAGIAVGCGVVGIAALVGCCWFVRKHRIRRRAEASAVGGTAITPAAPNPMGSPWGAHSSTYAPSASYPGSPYQGHPSAAIPAHPSELSADPGAHVWQAPNGVTYDLVSPGGYSAHAPFFGGSTVGSHTSPVPKIDSEGRVWMPRLSEMHVGGPRLGAGGYGGYPGATEQSETHELDSEPHPRDAGK
ncbi:hypothetical protein GQ53DRAFT_649582 [Thozetella sp. PMI_491]|nr:hypothetical protein GQ53DRAFT_649582 [Thozetella sp. PMI_491]